MKRISFGFLAILIIYATYLLILLSIPYLEQKPGIDFLKTKYLIYHIKHWRYSFYLHVFFSFLLLICGLFQFNKIILKRFVKIHRISGALYLIVLLLVSGPSALIMSIYANGGIPAQISFTLLSILWISFTFLAWLKVRKKQYIRHGKLLLCSYALTLSAVTLRFYAYLFDVFNVPLHPVDTYVLLSYLSWIPNLFIALVLIRSKFIEKLMA